MRHLKSVFVASMVAVTVTVSADALANGGRRGHGGYHHGGARVGVFIGAPVLGFGLPYYGYPGYGYAPYPYYGPATTFITPPAPLVYIEQNSVNATGPAADGYWYYCSNPDGYYPYVRQCSNGWQQVPSQPAQR